MAVSITQPDGLVACDCTGGNKVCVKGGGAIRNGVPAVKVHAKIYQPPTAPNPTTPPPAGCATTSPDASGNWVIGMLGGASCQTGSPYTDNKIWVWAEYLVYPSSSPGSSSSPPPPPTTIYEVVSQLFQGKCETNIPACT